MHTTVVVLYLMLHVACVRFCKSTNRRRVAQKLGSTSVHPVVYVDQRTFHSNEYEYEYYVVLVVQSFILIIQ